MRHPANIRHTEERTFGERSADRLAATVGSWPFLIVQTCIIVLWMTMNGYVIAHLLGGKPFDVYPFLLLNICLSLQAAFTGPVLQLSGNRQAAKDRDRSEHDYEVNRAALLVVKKLAQEAGLDVAAELAHVQHLLDVAEESE
ncbi:MAG TPA: DUF1003 domain-containing protein [Acidothermaceae bacterium]|nr:DUF1003 domain-containing protein [Acidothermaceae bacterium]